MPNKQEKCCEICEPFCYKNGVKCKCLCHQPTPPTQFAYTLSCPHGVAKEDCKKCIRGEKCELDNPNKCHHPERCVGECMQSEKPNVECTCDIKNGRHLLSCVHSTPPVQAQEEWEKKFDKEFLYSVVLGSTLNDGSALRWNVGDGKMPSIDKIKDFIRKTISSTSHQVDQKWRDKLRLVIEESSRQNNQGLRGWKLYNKLFKVLNDALK